jgi:hypothetical protein
MPMRPSSLRAAPFAAALAALAVLAGAAAPVTQAAGACGSANCLYLPMLTRGGCAATGQSYTQGLAIQHDQDNPVRPAYNHAGKNFGLRGYEVRTSGITPGLVDYGPGSEDPNGAAPQFTTTFSPARIQLSGRFFQMYDWNYAPPPNPGTRGSLLTNRPVTALGLAATAGEIVRAPDSPLRINGGIGAMVIYADTNSLTIKYTREDSSATGYTVYIDNICTDPNLLSLYNTLDNSQRNTFWGVGTQNYSLPYLTPNQAVGRAVSNEVVVAIVDVGAFEDPRSCRGWWTGYASFGVSCTPRPPGN